MLAPALLLTLSSAILLSASLVYAGLAMAKWQSQPQKRHNEPVKGLFAKDSPAQGKDI